MAQESEIKFKVEDFSAVRRALRRAGAEHIETVLHADSHFDTDQQHLRRGNETLRLRAIRVLRRGAEAAGSRVLLTHKGPGKANRKIKIRPETETHVEDARRMTRILTESGLKPWIRIEKRRASYRLGPCRIELDELPLIGRFVEIEGPNEKAIRAASVALGLDGEGVLESYLQLLWNYCRRHKRPFRHFVL